MIFHFCSHNNMCGGTEGRQLRVIVKCHLFFFFSNGGYYASSISIKFVILRATPAVVRQLNLLGAREARSHNNARSVCSPHRGLPAVPFRACQSTFIGSSISRSVLYTTDWQNDMTKGFPTVGSLSLSLPHFLLRSEHIHSNPIICNNHFSMQFTLSSSILSDIQNFKL